MKKLILSSVLLLFFSLLVQANNSIENVIVEEQAEIVFNKTELLTSNALVIESESNEIQTSEFKDEKASEEAEFGCFIISGCGAQAQWCSGGSHGGLIEYILAYMDHFC